MKPAAGLSRRQRQIMDILYQRGKSPASEVKAAMADAPSYSAVRAMLRVLEDKGYVRHQAEELRYVYVPTVPREKAKRSAVKHLLDTFFKDSPEQIVAALDLRDVAGDFSGVGRFGDDRIHGRPAGNARINHPRLVPHFQELGVRHEHRRPFFFKNRFEVLVGEIDEAFPVGRLGSGRLARFGLSLGSPAAPLLLGNRIGGQAGQNYETGGSHNRRECRTAAKVAELASEHVDQGRFGR